MRAQSQTQNQNIVNMSDENNKLCDFWGVKSSFVWKHFGFKQKTVDGKTQINKDWAVCRICKSELKYSASTSNLGNHLRIKHNIRGAGETTRKKDTESRQGQSLIKEAFGITQPLSKSKKQEPDKGIEDFVAVGLRPLSEVDETSFVNLMRIAEPRYTVPSRPTVVNRLKKRYDSMTSQVIALLLTIQFCAITHDSWTSIATQTFCAITIQILTKN